MKAISCQIQGDPVHPGFKTGVSAKTGQCLVCTHERILYDFFGILFVFQQHVCNPVEFGRIKFHQSIECRSIARTICAQKRILSLFYVDIHFESLHVFSLDTSFSLSLKNIAQYRITFKKKTYKQ